MFLTSSAQRIHILSLTMPDTARGGKGTKGGKVVSTTANCLDSRDLNSMVSPKGAKHPVKKEVKKEEGTAPKMIGAVRPPKIPGGMAANKGEAADAAQQQLDVAMFQEIVMAAAGAAASAAAAAASEAVVLSMCRAYDMTPPVTTSGIAVDFHGCVSLHGNADAVPNTPKEASPVRSRAPSPVRLSTTTMCFMNDQWNCGSYAIKRDAGWHRSRAGWKKLCPTCLGQVKEQQTGAGSGPPWAGEDRD